MSKRQGDAPALAFFRALWPHGLPASGRLVLIVKPTSDRKMIPEFHPTVEAAAAAADRQAERSVDLYFGVAAQPALSKGRGRPETALAIPGLWQDFDFDKGFADASGVRRLLAALPLPPTLLVATGGGIHAYWLFREYLETASEEDNRHAAGLSLGWLRYCREVARVEIGSGVDIDTVADLARIMRVPGGWNRKREPSVRVELLEINADRRYNIDDFESWRVEPSRRALAVSSAVLEFVPREGAQPPLEKWRVAIANDPEIEAVWDHRVKMPNDGSLSGYDQSLATRLDRIGWTPQEVVDAIVAHRSKWSAQITDARTVKDPLHLDDPAYFERMLRKARSTNDKLRLDEHALRLAEEVITELATTESPTPDHSQRLKWFKAVSEQLRVEVVDLWAADSIEGEWHVRLRCDGELRDHPVGGPERLLQWSFWVRVILASRAPIDDIPAKPPVQLRSLLSRAGSMLRVVGQQARRSDELIDYLLEVASEARKFEEAEVKDRRPFIKVDSGPLGLRDWGEPAECLFIRPDDMAFDVRMGRCPRLPNVRHALIGLGFAYRVVAARDASSATSRAYYCLPLNRLRSSKPPVAADADLEDGLPYRGPSDVDDPTPM